MTRWPGVGGSNEPYPEGLCGGVDSPIAGRPSVLMTRTEANGTSFRKRVTGLLTAGANTSLQASALTLE